MKNNKNEKALSTLKEKKEGKIKKAFNKFVDVLSKKWLVNGATTLMLIAIIIAIYLGVTMLLDKVTLPEIDLTTEKIYSLSDETKSKVGELDKEITITLINYSDYTTVTDLIKKYESINKKIEVVEIDDLTSRTDLMAKYTLSTDDSLIIIESEGRETTLTSSDLYTYDYSTYEEVDRSEEAITNAIFEVTTEKKAKIYFMDNHTMYPVAYFNTIIQTLEDDANEVDSVDLLAKGSVPEDCDCLVITTLKTDITEAEKNSIINYINNGGKLLLLCGANTLNVDLTNFNQVLDIYGITIEEGVIFEGKNSNMLSDYPDIIIEDVESNSTTKNMNMSLKAAFPDAAPIAITSDSEKLEELGVEYETLITTSSESFVRTNLNITSVGKTSADGEEKSYTIGVLATKEIDENKTSKLIIYSNELFVMDMQLNIGKYIYSMVDLYNNQDIVANAVAYLNEREDTITIRKNYDIVTFTYTDAQNKIVKSIIFGTPVIIIIIGIIVWIRRRRKQ